MKKNAWAPKLMLCLAMVIFGTIGVFRRSIPLPSETLSMLRGALGALVMMVLMLVRRKRFDAAAFRGKWLVTSLSGALIGVNWILLFEAYQRTTVSVATLCYYMAPVIVIVVSPFLFHERFSWKKGALVALAVLGMALVSGIFQGGNGRWDGILLALAAAVVYALILLVNVRLGDLPVYEKTTIQLAEAALVLLPYVMFKDGLSAISSLNGTETVLVLVVGIVHTGVAYALWFAAVPRLSLQTVAISSYIDPVMAVAASALWLGEPFGWMEAVGAVLILGATYLSQRMDAKEKTT